MHDVIFLTFLAMGRELMACNCITMAGVHKSNSCDRILAQGQDGCPEFTLQALKYRLHFNSSVSIPSTLWHLQDNDINSWKIKVLSLKQAICSKYFVFTL